MSNFFYFTGLILTLTNLSLLTYYYKYEKIREWAVTFQKVTGRNFLPSDFKENEYNQLKAYTAILSFNFLWMFFGLITSDWKILSIILLFNFLFNLGAKKVGEFLPIVKFLRFVKFIITTSIIGFLVVNHFNLHLDSWKVITQFHL